MKGEDRTAKTNIKSVLKIQMVINVNGTFYLAAKSGDLLKLQNPKSVRVITSKGKDKDGKQMTFVNKVLEENVKFIQVRGKDGVWRTIDAQNVRTVSGCKVQLPNGNTTFVEGRAEDGVQYVNNKTGKTVFATMN